MFNIATKTKPVTGWMKTDKHVYSFFAWESKQGYCCIAQSDTAPSIKFFANSEETAAMFLAKKLKASIIIIEKE